MQHIRLTRRDDDAKSDNRSDSGIIGEWRNRGCQSPGRQARQTCHRRGRSDGQQGKRRHDLGRWRRCPGQVRACGWFRQEYLRFPPKGKGVFVPDRVRFTYVKGDDGNKVLAMQRAKGPLKGTVTGEVLFSNDFWVAVKPKNGPLDGYAINWPPGSMVARLKALKKGDRVTIRFHTDVERHRIETLQVFPAKPPATRNEQ